MALNLSRNTKVFVSSVNGVGATGGVKTCHVSTAGTGYAVGDIVTLGTTSSNGTGFKCIVTLGAQHLQLMKLQQKVLSKITQEQIILAHQDLL